MAVAWQRTAAPPRPFQVPCAPCPAPPSPAHPSPVSPCPSAAVGVMFMDGARPSPAEAAALLVTLEQALVGFCVAAHGFTATAGRTAHAAVRAVAAGVVGPALPILAVLEAGGEVDVKRQVGQVWAACDALPKVPLDNKGVLFR